MRRPSAPSVEHSPLSTPHSPLLVSVSAATMPAPREKVQVREFAAPDLQPGGAIVRTLYSEVCGTDVHLHEGRLSGVPYPLIPGHVSVGTLTDIRGTIRDIEGQ